MDWISGRARYQVLIFPHVCGHLEFLWDLDVQYPLGCSSAHITPTLFHREGRKPDSFARVHSEPLSVFWVCGWVRDRYLLTIPFAWEVGERGEPDLSVPYSALQGQLEMCVLFI